MALLLPLLVTLIFGMLFGGILVFRNITISDAAREATRYGATLDDDPISTWGDQIYDRALEASHGHVDPSLAGHSVCVALYRYDEATSSGTWYRKDGPSSTGSTECFSDSRGADEERVQVLIERESEWNAVFWARTLTLEGRAVARYELGLGG